MCIEEKKVFPVCKPNLFGFIFFVHAINRGKLPDKMHGYQVGQRHINHTLILMPKIKRSGKRNAIGLVQRWWFDVIMQLLAQFVR